MGNKLVIAIIARFREGGGIAARKMEDCRGRAAYSLAEYRRFIHPRLSHSFERIVPILCALIPGVVANTYCILRNEIFRVKGRESDLALLRRSPACCQWGRIAE